MSIASIQDHLRHALSALRTDRASPRILDGVMVEAYGGTQRLTSMASVSVHDPRTLVVNVFDPKTVAAVDKAIRSANLGLNPVMNGTTLLVPFPPMTQDRREALVREAKRLAETARVAIRAERRVMLDALDPVRGNKKAVEDKIKGAIGVIDALLGEKITEITS